MSGLIDRITLKAARIRERVLPFPGWWKGPASPAVARPANGTSRSADIVVCVHNALDDVRACLAAIEANTPQEQHRLIIVNDGSNEATSRYLREHCEGAGAQLIANATPRRYTRAANQGLAASSAPYVCLLNSDTIVTPNWLNRMLDSMQAGERVGAAGPLSNAASYQSVPGLRDADGDWSVNPLPGGVSPNMMARIVASCSANVRPEPAFINGFCMLISRPCLDAVGPLDEVTFPNGYAEENDFCLRAAAHGFRLVIADDAYVYHAKSRSYSHAARRRLAARMHLALSRKHGTRTIAAALSQTEAASNALDPLRSCVRQHLATSPPPESPAER